MTESEAIGYVQSCGEDEGPAGYAEVVEIFVAIFGRAPDEDDGDAGCMWSHCCAAAS